MVHQCFYVMSGAALNELHLFIERHFLSVRQVGSTQIGFASPDGLRATEVEIANKSVAKSAPEKLNSALSWRAKPSF